MSDTSNPSAASNKKIDSFSLIDEYDKSYLFIRGAKPNEWFNIAKCDILPNGLMPAAVRFTAEEVAELLTKTEERQRRLENIESLLEEWIEIRRSRSREAKTGKIRLQRKEVVK